jgi:hypothetical protein
MTPTTNKREKISLGGYEMWLDRKRSILFDKENSRYGTVFDVMGIPPHIHISALNFTKEEKIELANYIKNTPIAIE